MCLLTQIFFHSLYAYRFSQPLERSLTISYTINRQFLGQFASGHITDIKPVSYSHSLPTQSNTNRAHECLVKQ